ncbi:MAG: hypothetical protein EPO38_05115 [Rhizorhabdus sp.]|jgi:hypothetical protein|nr:MAG: hypothetical protein EPO38_05115 [Rhizorhabdus sp.]
MKSVFQSPVGVTAQRTRRDPRAQVKILLLEAMVAAPNGGEGWAGLSHDQWGDVALLTRQHRLEAWAGRWLADKTGVEVPHAIAQRWTRAYRQSAMRVLAMRAMLHRLSLILGSEKIEHAALKGAYLTWHCWPEPALRPSRDIDILVARTDARRAFDVCKRAGLSEVAEYHVPFESALAKGKHLPLLRDDASGIYVEIHIRLATPGEIITEDRIADFTSAALSRAQAHPLGDTAMRYLDPTDTLLHLIIHGAYDHLFDNGPLQFGDLRFLLNSHNVDWHRFWRDADLLGCRRACDLVFAILRRLSPALVAGHPLAGGGTVPDHVVDAALINSLPDLDRRSEVRLRSTWRELDWAGRVHLSAVRSRDAMRRFQRMVQRSGRSALWLFGQWGVRRVLAVASWRSTPEFAAESDNYDLLRRWLSDPRP